MGRARDWFDGKQREENRRLIEGYILKNTKKETLPKTEYRANTEQVNTAPTSYSPVKVEMANPVPSNDVSLAKKYSAGQMLNSEAMNNLKKYQSENATSNATFKAGVPEDMTVFKNQSNAKFTREELLDYLKPHKVEFGKEREAVGQDAFENRKEYQFYNNLSRVPIVGNYAPMLAGGEYVLSVPLSAAEGAVNLGKQAFSKEKLGPENFEFAKRSAALREGALRAFRNNLGMQYDDVVDSREKTANFIGGVVADAASSSANNIALGRGSLAVAGLNAANQDMLESSQNERLTRNQLLASGIAHGAIEVAGEYLPTMHFLELSKYGLGTSAKEVAKNILKQSGQEGAEEFVTDILNDVSDSFIKGKESDVVKEYLARRENGENNTSAVLNTGASRLGSAGMSFLAGALSGGMSAGIAGATHTFSQGMRYNDVNNFKEIAESADTTTEEGKAIHEVANRLAEKEAKGQRITEFDRGYLSNAVENAAIEDYNRRKEELKSKDNLQESKDNHQEEAEAEKPGSVPYALFSNTEAGQQAKLENAINENLSKANRESINYKNPLQEFSKNYDTEGRKAFVENYDGSVPLTEYIKASTHAYNLGRYNYNLDGEDSLEKTASMALLSKEQRESLFKAGVKDYENAISKWNVNYKERIEKRTGGLMDSVPHAPENLKNVLGALGKKTGILFRIVDSKYQDGNTSNGSYEMGKGIITIDLQSDNILGTVSHEMTHWIKEYASDGADQGYYGWFKGLALNSILKSKNTDLDSLIETYKQSYGNLSNEEITDEIVADSTMHFLNDEEFINKLVNGTEEQKSIGMKVVQWLNDIIESFKDLISHNGERLASRALREDLARYEETRDAWLVAMSIAKENMAKYEAVTENSDSGELSQVQLQKVINQGKAHEQLLDHIYQTGTHNNQYVYIQETPKILTKILGVDNLPMVMDVEHVVTVQAKTQTEIEQKLNLTPQQAQYKTAHKLTAKDILKDIKAIETPAFIIRSDDKGKNCSFVVVTNEYDGDGKRVIVAVHPSDSFNYSKISIVSNRIKSLYGRNRFGNYLHNYESNIIYVDPSERHMKYFYKEENRGTAPTYVSLVLPATSVIKANLARFQMDVNKILQNVDLNARNNSNKVEPHFQNELQSFVNSQQNNTGNATSGTNTPNQLDISEEYYNSLVEENENLKEENSYLSDVLNAETRFEPSRSDVNRIASDLLSQYNSQFSKAKLADQLSGFYKYLSEARDIEGGEVRNVSRAIAREVIENATYKEDSEVQDYNKVKEFFSGRPIYITEGELHDLGYEKFGDLRKQYFGKIDFRKATVENRGNADDVYKSFAEAFPHLVTGDKSYTDELNNLIEAYEMATPKVYEAFPGEEHDHAVDRLSDEIYDAFLSVGDERLYQKYKDGYKKIKEKARAEVQAEYQKKYTKALDKIKQLRKDYESSLISHEEFIDAESRLLSRGGAEYQARLEMHRAYRQKQDEQRHRQIYKKEIVRDSKALMKMAVNPTDNLHVPKVLLKDLVPVLSAVDFSSYDAFYEKKPKIEMTANEFKTALATLTSRIQEAEKNGDVFTEENGKGVYFPIDPSLVEGLSEIKDAVDGIGGNMNRLSTEELQTLRDSLRGFKHIVESQNKYISMQSNERISDVSNAVISDLKKEKTGSEYGTIAGTIKNGLQFNMLDPLSYFHTMGDGGDKIYKMLRNARDKKTLAFTDIMDKYHEGMEKLGITPKDTENLSKDRVKFTATSLDDMQEHTVEMTKAGLMSMYLYTLRDQARMHLFGEITNSETGERQEGDFKLGGFIIKENPGGILGKTTNAAETYKLSAKETEAIIKEHLGEKEIALAKLIGSLLSNDVAMYGNEASNAVYGYDKFTEKNYFPIKVDSDSLTMKNADLEKMMSTLKNKGMTKALQKEAYNPIVIDDIFDVMVKHIDEMTSYSAYFPAITDMQKFYNMNNENGDSVHRQISRVMGKGGTEYYMNLLRDLNGSRGEDTPIGKMAYGLAGLYKGALIGNNLRVAVQQPMSYMRAMGAIEAKYLMQGLSLPVTEANKEWELCQKYAPIAKWKALGGSYDINLGRSTRSLLTGETSPMDKINAVSFFLLEKGDEAAWKRMWYAAEKKVEDTTSLKKGSEEYYKAAADIFNDIVDKTQVVDTVLNRTDAMKDKTAMARTMTSFMSEPSKTYNMVYRLVYDVKRGKATAGEVGSVLSSILVSSAMVSAAASLVSAMRDRDKEKKFGERWLDHFFGDYLENINPINWVPIAKDLFSAGINILQGKPFYSNNLATKPLEDVLGAIKEINDVATGKSKKTWIGAGYKVLKAFNVGGISLYNLARDTAAIYDTIIYDSPLANVKAQFERDESLFKASHQNNKGAYDNLNRLLKSALKAYTLGDTETGNYIVNKLKNQIPDDIVNEALQRNLSKDETISLMAEKKLNGEDYTEEKESLLEQSYTEEMIDKAVDSAFKKLKPVSNEDLAESLFEQSEGYKDNLSYYIEYQKAKGEDDKQIRSSIKSAVTSKYKKLYQDAIGNPAVSDEILKKILRITYDGKQLYTEKDLKQWAK
nr:MAG TPA: hypothetical protein [Caudoviricetes sp.]